MKNSKKVLVLGLVISILSIPTVAFAADIKSPADIVAALTGKTVTQVTAERASGKTYGTIAKDAGKLDEFKKETLVQKKLVLDQQVKDKKITQAQADTVYTSLKNNQATCDATGSAKIGSKNGVGFGSQGTLNGTKAGIGNGNGKATLSKGTGNGRGNGGLGAGSTRGNGNVNRTGVCDGTGIVVN